MGLARKIDDLAIGKKLLLWVSLISAGAIGLVAYIAGHSAQALATHDVAEIARQTAYHYANVAKSDLEVALDEARSLARLYQATLAGADSRLSRPVVNAMLKDYIERGSYLFGVYVGFEANGYDGQDASFANTPGHDGSGRFLPYWTRDASGKGVLEPLADYEKEGAGDYYLIPRKTKRETVIDPYIYKVQGQDVLMTSLVVPILGGDGNFLGIGGIDLALAGLQEKIAKVQLLGGGYVTLYSQSGIVAGSKKAEYCGKSVKETTDSPELIDKVLHADGEFLLRRLSRTTGEYVVTYGVPVEIGFTGIKWKAVVNIPEKALFAEAKAMVAKIALVGGAALLLTVFMVQRLAASISRPLQKVVAQLGKLREGDLGQEFDLARGDEVGALGRAMAAMVAGLRERAALAEAIANGDLTQAVAVNSERDLLGLALGKMVANLAAMLGRIRENSSVVATSSEELAQVSSQLVGGAEEMRGQATNVASASEQVSTNINTMATAAEEMSVNIHTIATTAEEMSHNMSEVAAAIEEMTVAIGAIAENTKEGAEVSGQALAMSEAASRTMGVLGEAAKEIGAVTTAIKRIADKTNLLALNATIEAASAGEAGKGFAVVANEIKELANQSAKAADEIAKRIGGVQANTEEAVRAIAAVGGIIGRINSSSAAITEAVEQQRLTAHQISANVQEASVGANSIASSIGEVASGANDMSRNAGEAAKGVNDVSANIHGVNAAAGTASDNARQVNGSAVELAKVSGQLQEIVGNFKLGS